MTIYTRRGDHGETSLADGSRVSKTSARVEAYGTVDEANSAVGLARAASNDAVLDEVLYFVQQRLFNCSSSLATPGAHSETVPHIEPADIEVLENAIDLFQNRAGEQTQFVIVAGTEVACRLHLARAIMRRAERNICVLAAEEPIAKPVLAFVNRCSDLLFAAARYCNATQGGVEEQWDSSAPRPSLPTDQ